MRKLQYCASLLLYVAVSSCWVALAQAQTPTLTATQPASGVQGATVDVVLTGANFGAAPSLSITGGSGILVLSVRVSTPTTAVATLVLSAPAGDYSLSVVTSGGTSAALTFRVTASAVTAATSVDVTAYAGPDGGPGSRDGAGLDARFNTPTNIWDDGTYIYVADSGNAVIRRVTASNGQVATIAGALQETGSSDGTGSAAHFSFPFGIWGTGSDLYITDRTNRNVRKLNLTTGNVTTVAGLAGAPASNLDGTGTGARFVGPTGIWGDGTSLYVADSLATSSRTIRRITIATGAVTTVANLGSVPDAPDFGVGLWGDGANLWIADSSRHTIRKWVIGSTQITTFAGADLTTGDIDGTSTAARFDSPSVIWGSGTTLYVGDTGNFIIRQISTTSGDVTTLAGLSQTAGYVDGSGVSARFGFIEGIWTNGSVAYISESTNQTIRVLNLSNSAVSRLAGKPARSGSADATGIDARFSSPLNVWGDANFIYVADTDNATVRKIVAATGVVTTVAGTAQVTGSADGQGAAASFYSPLGVWGDGQNLYVADYFADTIRKIVISSGSVTTIAGSASAASGAQDGVGTAARFFGPWGIWGDGVNLYVSDNGNLTIRKIVIATLQVTTFAGAASISGTTDGVGTAARFTNPTGLWGDGTYLYVADGNAIRRIVLATGEVTTIAGDALTAGHADGKGALATFDTPIGIWSDGSSLFVADTVNALIRKINLSSLTVSTIAGQYPYFGSENDRGAAARFFFPSGLWGDGASLYVADFGTNNIRKLAPGVSELSFTLSDRMSLTRTTTGAGGLQVGFARILPNSGSSTPSGMAIFSNRAADGVLVSEAAVPASPLIQAGRIFAEVAFPVNTGLAIANPNGQPVTINFYFTDASGNNVNFGAASIVIEAFGQLARFLDQEPYIMLAARPNMANVRTFTFTSSLPVSVIALRGFTNERNEFLMTTLPVVPVSATDATPIIFSHFADGGGWTTQILLVNSGEDPISGTIEFFTRGTLTARGAPATVSASGVTASTFSYTIAPRSAFKLRTAGTAAGDNSAGWVRVTPNSGGRAPVGLLVFTFRPGTVTLSESGVPALPAGSAFRIYTEAAGNFGGGARGSTQTGVAITNPSNANVTVTLELIRLDGSSTGFTGSLAVPANGQVAKSLNEISGLDAVPLPFQGLVRITGASVVVVGLRLRINERGDYLIITTPPVNEAAPPPVGEFVFPHLADGGGYTTQLILFSGAAGQSASGTVRFYSFLGQPLSIAFQ